MCPVDLGTVGGLTFNRGYAGQEADSASMVRISRVVEPAGGLAWGAPVGQGAAGGCKPYDGTSLFLGVARKQPQHPAASSGTAKYAQGDSATIIEEGSVFILAGENGRDGDEVIMVVAEGVATWGSSQGGAANGTTRVATPGQCTYEGAAVAGTIAKIRLRAGRAKRTTT